jgi:hypothetical protein
MIEKGNWGYVGSRRMRGAEKVGKRVCGSGGSDAGARQAEGPLAAIAIADA